MTFRGTNSTTLDIVRGLIDEIDILKRQTGSVKQNTIRLGDWVLEAVDDSRVKMTNLATGVISFIGGEGDGGDIINQTLISEFPPFVVGGVVRIAFGNPIRTNVYTVPNDITISQIIATVASLGSSGGIVFKLTQNGTIVYTSPSVTTNKVVLNTTLAFVAGDDVYMSVTDDGDSDSIGLAVMLRA